ncbi:MAG TPA: PQQ-binding-like beta-propeller repeat protein [Pirellulales bacterium]|nr:PQQ-binding-like beta-propeller repeat protein [Pirellulales bacterium]
MRVILVAALLSMTAGPMLEAGETWPQFRGPDGQGISDAKGVPVEWNESKNVKWKTPIRGRAWSSPVIWHDQVWLTTATEDGKELSILKIERATGKILLDKVVFEIAKPQFCYPFNSYASSTPAIEEGRIYVHYGSHGTACLDTATGETLWTRQDLPCNHHRGAGSSPILFGDLVFINFDGYDLQYVVALDKATGQTVWKQDRDIDYGTSDGDAKKSYGTPLVIEVGGKPLLVSPAAGGTTAYDPLSGKIVWRLRHGGMNAAAPPLFGHGLLFLNTADGGFRELAVPPEGKGDITANVLWKQQQAMPSRCAPLLVGDLLFMTNEAGILTCLEATTGNVVWRERLGGHYSASPVYADGHVYFVSEDGELPVIAAGRKYELLATNKLDEGCMASPAIAGREIFIRTKKSLYCIEQSPSSPGTP